MWKCRCLIPSQFTLFGHCWNVNSQETDFYFTETVAQCRSELQSNMMLVPEKICSTETLMKEKTLDLKTIFFFV